MFTTYLSLPTLVFCLGKWLWKINGTHKDPSIIFVSIRFMQTFCMVAPIILKDRWVLVKIAIWLFFNCWFTQDKVGRDLKVFRRLVTSLKEMTIQKLALWNVLSGENRWSDYSLFMFFLKWRQHWCAGRL